jgi:hypothetical protein
MRRQPRVTLDGGSAGVRTDGPPTDPRHLGRWPAPGERARSFRGPRRATEWDPWGATGGLSVAAESLL